MNTKLLTLILLLLSGLAHAQDSLITLHPAVGAQIDKSEKSKYYLFAFMKDTTFRYIEVHKREGKFYLLSHFKKDSISETEIQAPELDRNRANVEKLQLYYSQQEKKDTISKVDLSKDNTGTMNKELAAPGLSEQQKKELERDARLKQDQERMNNYQKGMETSPTNIEIYNSEKKKKKK